MTRTMTRRPLTPIGLIRQRHGNKRKGKPVEAWKMDVEQDKNAEDVCIRGVHLNAIEEIANAVEQMMFSWNLDTFERGQEHAKIFTGSTNPNPLPLVNDEVQSSEPKVDSIKSSRNPSESGIHKLHNDLPTKNSLAWHGLPRVPNCAVNTQRAYPLQALPQSPGDATNVETRAPLEVAENSEVTIRQDRMSGGTVSKRRRDCVGSLLISTCEKNVGTDARSFQELQTPRENLNKVAMTKFSPHRLVKEESQTLFPISPSEKNCYPENENSCPYQFLGFSVAERQVQVSPRREESVGSHASTLTHSMPNFPHSRSEDDNRLEKGTFVDVIARDSAAHTDSPTLHGCRSIRPNSGTVLHSSNYYWRRPTGAIETLEVGGRPVTVPALWNGTEALKNKFESPTNMTSGALFTQGKESPCSAPPKILSMEELQLALIECATEYEIKTLDARMKMQEMRVQKRQITGCEFDQLANAYESQNHVHKMMSTYGGAKISQSQRALQHVQRVGMRPGKLKENMQKKDSHLWKKKERLFDNQRRNLDDALNHVDNLQKEVAKKDRELVEWQLKEKATKTQLHELEDKVKTSRVFQASSRLEPRKLHVALPALRESLRSLKTEEQKKVWSPLADTSEELISNSQNKAMSEDRDCSLNARLQSLENRTFEMNKLKVTMSELASNMAELSMAFNDYAQFVNNRLGAIHCFVTKRNIPSSSDTSPELVPPYVLHRNMVGQLKLATLETLETEREIMRSSTP